MMREVVLPSLREAARHPRLRLVFRACAALTMLLTVVATTFWWPAERELSRVEAAVEATRRALVTHLQAGEIAEAYQASLERLPRVEQKLATAISQSELIQRLSQLASQKSLKVLAQSLERGGDAETRGAQALELTLVGDYRGIRGFISGLAEFPVLIEVTELRLERARERNPALLQAQLRLLVHRKERDAEPRGRI